MANIVCYKLGILAQERKQFNEAIANFIKSSNIIVFDINEGLDKPIKPIGKLGEILKTLGNNQFNAIWREVTGKDCTGELREAIWAARDRL